MPNTIGFVDGMEGTYVRGWAVSDGGSPASITIADATGTVLARGEASLERPDIGRLGLGPTACGFRVPLARIGALRTLHIFGDGAELTGSPVRVGAGLRDGAVAVRDGVAVGWVTERADGFQGAAVRLHDQDGTLLGEADAAMDPDPPDPGFAPARFSIPLGQVCFGRADLIARASVDGSRFAETRCALRLDGHLDALTAERCTGWLMSPDAPDRGLVVAVFRGSRLVGTGVAELPREDVRAFHPHAIRVGFDIALEAPPPNGEAHPIYSIRLADTETELFDGPLMLEDRAGAIEAARRLGRRARLDPTLGEADRTVLRRALAAFIDERRHGETAPWVRVASPPTAAESDIRLSIVIPIHRGLEFTTACIASVLADRDPARDVVVLVNDCSPEPGMIPALEKFAREPGVFVLNNAENSGFVRSANRGIAACRGGDIVLLNSGTRVFPGGFDELFRIGCSSPDIGTVTPLSNNATLFSYPYPNQANATLPDIGWDEIAAVAREANAGVAIDVPTGHGFCLLIRREVLALAGMFDEAFGRGYGEENDFCQRGADLGFRDVAAAGAFVEHRDAMSFSEEKAALVAANLALLGRRYPDYPDAITAYTRDDALRRARWPLDAARLRKAGLNNAGFALVVTNWLDGGARRAIADIETATGYGGAEKLMLRCRADGMIVLETETPALRSVFAAHETAALFELLAAARITRVQIHQVLGFGGAFLDALTEFVAGRPAIFHAHDFYPICQRVTLIDAAGGFCDIAPPATCARCVAAGGAHEASRLDGVTPERHRVVMGTLLGAVGGVVAPSDSAASYLRRVWPNLALTVAAHPEPALTVPAAARTGGDANEIVLLGGIGPHKGSALLLAIAQRARLSHPELRFRVIGHTNIDKVLRALGNVSITGVYERDELAGLLARTKGRIALFLHQWPETWSYTLSEAVAHGFYPLVPDLGAPAERVRRAGWGAVFGFPINAGEVLDLIAAVAARSADADADAAIAGFASGAPAGRSRSRTPLGEAAPIAIGRQRKPAASR